MLTAPMKSKINSLWDKFWSGGISNPLTAIEQISYLLFMRRLDELDLKNKADAEWLGAAYTSTFDGEFELPNMDKKIKKSTLRWSYFKHMEGGEMLVHIQTNVFPFIKQLNGSNSAFGHYMRDAVFIIPKPSLLVEAVSIIDSLYEEIEKEAESGQTFFDTQGDMYEYLLSEIASAGKNGQFRTPRHIIQLMCTLLNPQLGESVADLAAGTAGFILGSYLHILTQHTSPEHCRMDADGFTKGTLGDKLTDDRLWKQLKEDTFFCFDFDSTMVRIGLMNLMLHGITNPNMTYKDTLSKSYTEENRYNVILANPPFKGSIDKGDINENLHISTTKTELLFVNRIYNALTIGGRAAIIVPDGVLFGSSNAHKELRKLIIDNCELQAVISMPSGVFKPYAGVSTAIIIFVKGGTTENVWFYDMLSDGYTLDDKRDRIDNSDIPDIIAQWSQRHKADNTDRTAKNFFVPKKEIVENGYDLSISRYKEILYAEEEYEKPLTILTNLKKIENDILKEINELEDFVS